ncbi:MAG TPA: glycosyltransferase family A protein [Vicinamibacterales bacterium]|jgi:GT2 family glycosyltransferase|nr:glycosyltransferase family A protein [Vicinamibacterales bacterium]
MSNGGAETPALTLTIAVPTRNRPEHAVECARSILATDGFADLIVVDQSDGRATEEGLSRIQDPRLRYVRTDTRGVTRGRNIAINLSRSDIVGFTDDDCRVPADWPKRIVDVFTADPSVAVVCGRVVVPEEIRHLGYAEGFEPTERVWEGRYPPLGRDWGITANMSLRTSILERVGVFDPMLGAGAPLRSGGEPDFLFRVLRAGMKVVNAEEVVVDHYGIRRPGEEFRKLILGYSAGTAAALFKHVRLGDPDGIRVYMRFLVSTLARVSGNVVRGRRPTHAAYLVAFLSGTLNSYKFAVHRKRREYVER